MPCYEVNLITVDLVATNRDLLEQAIKKLGYRYQRDGNNFIVGSMNISGSTITGRDLDRINSIKRQYSIETVKKVAKKKGWVGAWKMNGLNKTGNKVVLKKY